MTQVSSDFSERLGTLLPLVADYVGHHTVQIGLQHGIFGQLASHPEGVTPSHLAAETGLDESYVDVWCRSGYAAGVLDSAAGGYRLDAPTATLLTTTTPPSMSAASSDSSISPKSSATRAFVDLLAEHGFEAIGSFDITPTHAVIHGRLPTA